MSLCKGRAQNECYLKWDPFTQTEVPRDPDFGYAYCTPPDHHRPAGQ